MEAESLVLCQELDGSWLLGVSKLVMLWVKGSVIQWMRVQKRVQSSSWTEDERNWIGVKI